MQILVISGFLGAGKTTFIKKLVEMTGERFVILENDYGALPVDSEVLRETTQIGEVNVWELTEGCVCCSVKQDFATSLLTISNTLDPEYLIVEPTGVGMLSNILQNISQIEYDRISLLRPITIIDANCFDSDMVEFEEICRDQVVSTDRIILSKTEQMPADELDALAARLRALNPEAELDTEHYSKKPKDWWLSLLRDAAGRAVLLAKGDEEPPGLETVGIQDATLRSIGELVMLLEDTMRGTFGAVRRAKGCVRVQESTLRFDLVKNLYQIAEISESAAANVVYIGRNLDRAALEKKLRGGAPLRLKPFQPNSTQALLRRDMQARRRGGTGSTFEP